MKNYAESFRDLRVYRMAIAVEGEIFRLTKTFPKSEQYSLTDQVRRSSRAIGAQIAEAWAKRRYPAHFTSKLTDADAEQQETQLWLECASRAGYVRSDDVRYLIDELCAIGRMLHGMTEKTDLFCGKPCDVVREERAEYLVSSASSPDHGSRITDYVS